MEEWDEGAAYRKVRHAANVGGCYSTETICLAAKTFCNQQLTDDLVANRLAYGEFTAAELNPQRLGAPSVCLYVSAPMLNRLVAGMDGTFTAKEAWHFMDYHVDACDAKTVRLVADITHFTAEERREFMACSDEWTGQLALEPEDDAPAAEPEAPKKETHGCLTALGVLSFIFMVLVDIALVLSVGMPGIFMTVITVIVFYAVLKSIAIRKGWIRYERKTTETSEDNHIGPLAGVMMISDSIKQSEEKKRRESARMWGEDYPYRYEDTSNEKFPDYRSSFQRRAWAEDHNWDADGGNEHNYDADG